MKLINVGILLTSFQSSSITGKPVILFSTRASNAAKREKPMNHHQSVSKGLELRKLEGLSSRQDSTLADGGGGLDDVQMLPGSHEIADGVDPIYGDGIGGDAGGRGSENQGAQVEATASFGESEERESTNGND